MKDKELLIASIKDYDLLSNGQRAIMVTLLNFYNDDSQHSKVSVTSIAQINGISRTIAYQHLYKLQKLGLVELVKPAGGRLSEFRFSEDKLKEIINLYQKKQSLMQKNKE